MHVARDRDSNESSRNEPERGIPGKVSLRTSSDCSFLKDDLLSKRQLLLTIQMEAISATSSLVSLLQIYRNAVQVFPSGDIAEHRRLLQKYSLLMNILEDCAGIIQTSAGERHLNTTIIAASEQCTDLGREIAFRLEKFSEGSAKGPGNSARKRIAFALAPWEKLQAMHEDFQSSVLLLHGLTQDLLLREVVESQNDLRGTIAAKTLNTMQGFSDRRYEFGNHSRRYSKSMMTERSQFTASQASIADVVTVADELITSSIAKGIQFDNDPSLTLGTITVTHEDKPRFVPVRAKFDTASDVNFIPSSLIENQGLSHLLNELDDDDDPDANVFIGLNNQEYAIRHTITLQWCAATMHRVRTTQFHVADDLPYDLLLGNPFIQENRVFHPQRVALPLRRKHRSPAQTAAEAQRKQAHDHDAAKESTQERNEDATRRALEREARRLAKEQTSASSMVSVSPNPGSFSPGSGAILLPSDSSSHGPSRQS